MITDIRLQHFRSYKDAAFELSRGVNIVVGPNASGKTNLLEALLVLARGTSYRAGSDELIQFDKLWARVDAHTPTGQRTVKIDRHNAQAKKAFEINGKSLSRLPMEQTIPTVLFEPQHLQLLTGRPDMRRDYLDDLLEQTALGYAKLRRDYRRALSQRNALLKKGPTTAGNQLFAWNIRLSELGGQIATQRHKLVESLNQQIDELYKRLSNSRTGVELRYNGFWEPSQYSSQLLRKLEENTDLDYARGFTAYGPHREDLSITLGRHEAQGTASRGETRTILMALKMLELQMLEEARSQKPLLLLDDVFSELDGARRRALTEFLSGYQTFITTTDADIVTRQFASKANIIPTKS